MIFLLSYVVFASALEYPFWGDWQYEAEMMTYSQLVPAPGCGKTLKCAPLVGRSFSGWELDLCLDSAKKGCTFVAEPSVVLDEYLTYQSWEDTDKDLMPPNWAVGCNTSVFLHVKNLYATHIHKFQDYFAKLPAYDFEVKNGYFELTLNKVPDIKDNFALFVGNHWDLSKDNSWYNINYLNVMDLTDEWEGPTLYIPFDKIIGKGNVLASLDIGANSNENVTYVRRMTFRSERFVAYFKATSDSATLAISIGQLLLLSVAFIIGYFVCASNRTCVHCHR